VTPKVAGSSPGLALSGNNLGQIVHTYVPLSPSSIIWYRSRGGDVCLHGLCTRRMGKVCFLGLGELTLPSPFLSPLLPRLRSRSPPLPSPPCSPLPRPSSPPFP